MVVVQKRRRDRRFFLATAKRDVPLVPCRLSGRAGPLALAALAIVCVFSARGDEEPINPFSGDATAAAEGKRIFLKAGCYACHGHEAEGAVGPDLTDDEWIYKPTDVMIFNTIAKGRRGTVMAPFADHLTPEEIWKIVEFLRDKNRQRQSK